MQEADLDNVRPVKGSCEDFSVTLCRANLNNNHPKLSVNLNLKATQFHRLERVVVRINRYRQEAWDWKNYLVDVKEPLSRNNSQSEKTPQLKMGSQTAKEFHHLVWFG